MSGFFDFEKKFNKFVVDTTGVAGGVDSIPPKSDLVKGKLMVHGSMLVDSGFGNELLRSALVCIEGNSLFAHAPIEWNEIAMIPERLAGILLPLQSFEQEDASVKNESSNAIEFFFAVKFKEFKQAKSGIRLAVFDVETILSSQEGKWDLLAKILSNRQEMLKDIPLSDDIVL